MCFSHRLGALCHCATIWMDSYAKRSEAVADVLSNLRRDPSLRCLKGWRDETNEYHLLLEKMFTSYTYEDEDGVSSECSFIFDLELPPTFKPSAGDGKVQKFYLLPIEKVKKMLAPEDFKSNSAMVVLDFLIRHSVIEPDREPFYQEIVSGLHQDI